ncbi:MAG TPA: (d)CMP kinase [Firmicutes bacterium]|nr:(d)CMP kinase [Bacillota bacterium]
MNIAIDGPAGAGKSTIAKAVAKRLGYIYVDTGAMYRGIGLYALEHGADPKSAKEVGDILDDIAVSIKYKDGEQRLLLNGEDVSDRIRTPEVSAAASAVSALPAVREKLLDLQRELARNNDAVMDGRDIGSFVLPNADVKIFLTASADVRARRRYDELVQKGIKAEFSEVKADMEQRDKNDSTRKASPLVMAEDSILVDTTDMDIERTIEKIIELCDI